MREARPELNLLDVERSSMLVEPNTGTFLPRSIHEDRHPRDGDLRCDMGLKIHQDGEAGDGEHTPNGFNVAQLIGRGDSAVCEYRVGKGSRVLDLLDYLRGGSPGRVEVLEGGPRYECVIAIWLDGDREAAGLIRPCEVVDPINFMGSPRMQGTGCRQPRNDPLGGGGERCPLLLGVVESGTHQLHAADVRILSPLERRLGTVLRPYNSMPSLPVPSRTLQKARGISR